MKSIIQIMKIRGIFSLVVFSIATLATFSTNAATTTTNLIVNGGFEQPGSVNNWTPFNPDAVDGWGGSNTIEIWETGFNNVDSYEGGQHAELNSTGSAPFSIYQDITTVAGQTYQLSFAYRARKKLSESFLVTASTTTGSNIFSQLIDDHILGQWSTFTQTFIAVSEATSIAFTSVYPDRTVGNFLDDISVSAVSAPITAPVPLPAAAPLFASVLGLFGFLQLRRRAKPV